MQTIFVTISELLWIVLLTVWFFGFFRNKKTTKLPNPYLQLIANTLLFSSYYFLFNPFFKGLLAYPATSQTVWFGAIGVLLTIAGVAFAIWARVFLGKNWSGAVITLKADHKLITLGPYQFVRHPIYTGWLFATIGTALAIGTFAAYIAVVLNLIGFLLRIQKEEALMTAQFPAEYSEYKKSSKMLVPFIW
ncbi:hypothetical protein A3C09_02945 [Candidatus Uhrbacteria bacterium RIFCSPHIGHO2_02_FULL_47_44]|uniref:Steroid 5-alpha reductase C-terminal domain-containing protein n=1 Tax=Candidatus Uhrbacteria bacterium RIFCSPLOWO2_02_FULL_48_18 TaxID=1802408 RepID=A0A1F7VAF5_9BACT|nr:MAG: hypothetical protein A2839_00205 [Candidatus Uhrbacteria bacterium RIFCSPHIGHO2_01_FULL_47_10]OGL71433.1 MAG: hypothetical protein A3C09_02945 [Candidatus Uhrbacteria bacterium RIFCSPHIGHO2_02_FULL_47_44]OGL76154.1 MAG: hypothetical protein A3E97_02885 [Candidatus Uhrbacteria bacterium RIFCSPHIGHO2_12_FULL_47_12]OGL81925.1 MAG: hypothetical protein A3B20_02465 [Candidatus Uhrbacteria bacterium RIFCSPLOWO2_01_FULL_47_17]OGL87088.1 MAG: hypothetical protein A3I41_04055 [Candidatus Uhrbact